MSPQLKSEIRRRILATGQLDIGEFHPEAFLDVERGGIVTAINSKSPTPQTKFAFVTTDGKLVCHGAAGHN